MGKETVSTVDRYKGCLVGVAVGDALGQPLEFASEKPDKPVKDMLPNPFGYWKQGEYTDDTAQTLLLADSFIDNQTYNPDDFVKRLIDWFDDGKAKGLGNTTKISLSLINGGTPWKEAGRQALTMGGVAANGSLMRTAPIGLFFRDDQESIRKVAAEISGITHAAEASIEACQMASQLVASFVSGEPRNQAIYTVKERYRTAFNNTMDSLPDHKKYPGSAYVTFAVALSCFVNAGTPEEAIIDAVNRGGDTDTQASITGAFAGAYWGVAQIPARWVKEINPQTAVQIADKAQKLYAITAN